MPVGFVDGDRAAGYGAFAGVPSTEDLARFFVLDAEDRAMVGRRRTEANRVGFAVQLCTVRFVGVFVPIDEVPPVVVAFVADQLDLPAEAGAAYGRRPKTVLEHQWEIRQACGYADFGDAVDELREFLAARAWTRRERAGELFDHAVAWLRGRRVLLPGLSVLQRLVAEVRSTADERMYTAIASRLSVATTVALEALLVVEAKERISPLERLRRAPTRASARELIGALHRVSELRQVGAGSADLRVVPSARLAALARHGLATKAAWLRRQPDSRRIAAVAAAVRSLETTALDDAIDVFMVLMAERLIRPAERASDRQRLRVWDELATASVTLASVGRVLLDLIVDVDDEHEPLAAAVAWERLRSTIQPATLADAVGIATGVGPTGTNRQASTRAALLARYATVAQFCRQLMSTIPFSATAGGAEVLQAARRLPDLSAREQVAVDEIVDGAVTSAWRPLVVSDGVVDRRAYVVCVLEALYRALRRRDVFVEGGSKWGDPRAQLLSAEAWQRARPTALAALDLTSRPDRHIGDLAARFDVAIGRFNARAAEPAGDVEVDERGRLHLGRLHAVAEPASLIELRGVVAGMLPRVDLADVVMEVHAWTGCFDAFTHASDTSRRRDDDLAISLAAIVVADACNLGLTPVVKPAEPALSRHRLFHVAQNYVRAETIAAANARLIDAQAEIPTAQVWGGGLVASVDGLRFVVPVRTLDAGPNPGASDLRVESR